MNKTICVSFTAFLLAGVVACAVAPVQEMSDARQAISAARSAGAEQSARDKLDQAENLLKKAEDDLSAGAYDKARTNAAAARDAAMKARGVAQSK